MSDLDDAYNSCAGTINTASTSVSNINSDILLLIDDYTARLVMNTSLFDMIQSYSQTIEDSAACSAQWHADLSEKMNSIDESKNHINRINQLL